MKNISSNSQAGSASDYGKILATPFPESVEETVALLDITLSDATELSEKIVRNKNGKMKITDKAFLSNFFSPYSKEIKYVSQCVEKAEGGIQRLNSVSASDHPGFSRSIINLQEGLAALKEGWMPQLKQLRKRKTVKNYAITAGIIIVHIIFYSWLFKHL